MIPKNEQVIQAIRELRIQLGYNHTEFARVLDVDLSTESRYEAGKQRPKVALIRRMLDISEANAFGPLVWIFQQELMARGKEGGSTTLGKVHTALQVLGNALEVLMTEYEEGGIAWCIVKDEMYQSFKGMTRTAEHLASRTKEEKRLAHNANMLARYYAAKSRV